MPEGGILTIHVADAAAKAEDDDPVFSGSHACLSVRDTGVGMPPEIVEKAFEPFFTTKPIGQGTGLGLSMVHGFAHQSGGAVRVDSAPGAGTTISLHLPLSNGAVASGTPLVAAELAEGRGRRVLFVEDDPAVRLLIEGVMKELGFEAIEAADPAYAVEVLGSEVSLDLMISDVGLPGMNGRQLAEVARAGRPELPILFITGYAENAMIRADFLSANMAMITKPFSVDTLSRRIKELLVGAN